MARTKQTARMTTAPSPAMERYFAKLRRTQERIMKLLDGDGEAPTLANIVDDLATLDTRAFPCISSQDELTPKLNPRHCCFDSASFRPSWTCHAVCARCKVLRQLKRTSGEPVVQNLVSQVLLTTDCEGAKPSGGAPSLPQELIDMIFDFALEALRKGDTDYRVLLHVSSMMRLRATQALRPMEILNLAEGSGGSGTMLLHRQIPMHASNLLSLQLADVTVKRYARSQPRLEGAAFGTVARYPSFAWTVEAEIEPRDLELELETYTHTLRSRIVSSPEDPALTIADAYETLSKAFEGLDAKAWSFANPFMRSYQPKSEEGIIVARVTITLSLPEDGENARHRFWRFVM